LIDPFVSFHRGANRYKKKTAPPISEHGLLDHDAIAVLFHLDDFTSPIVSTFWADDMRALHRSAVVTLDKCNGAEFVVEAASISSTF